MRRLLPLLMLISSLKAQPTTIRAFPLEPNDLELCRPAQATQYFDKVGTKAAVMGDEGGTFEAWIWPWKPLRNFELSFLLGTSTQPFPARDIVKTISVTPEATVLTYAYESFTVKELVLVPHEVPAIILLLDVRTTVPLTIIASFLPVMQPMWPAGIGGQYSYWDNASGSYLISEGQRRAVFLCGSPRSQQIAAPPAHMLADTPLQFRVDIKPNESAGRLIPMVIAGGAMHVDSARTLFERCWKNAERHYRQNAEYYRSLRATTVQLHTPDPRMNLAFEWGKVSLDNLIVENPRLGRGMVAGFGRSGSSARPGFAWFFGGDAFINSLALNSVGASSGVREALLFAQQWQRQDNFPVRKKAPDELNGDIGKMSHELSQSEGLVDWWNDYHYGYNHADTTPWYIVAVADYVRTTGDISFLRRSWSSIRQAYEWCMRKDSDGDGLMDLKGAGLGALEFGKLVGIYADVYTSAVWTQAAKDMIDLADLAGDQFSKRKATTGFDKARTSLEERFWISDLGYYAYGATEQHEQVREKTPWQATAMMFGLLNEERTTRALDALNSAEICTDWGTRSLSPTSALYDPANYNYGAVWPFISAFLGTAEYRYHNQFAGHRTLMSIAGRVFDNGLGEVPEVFSGEFNTKLSEAYHHQGFSTTGYLLPLMRGMLGLSVDANASTLRCSPHLPADWDSVTIRNIPLRQSRVDIALLRTASTMELAFNTTGPDSIHIEFSPALPPGAEIRGLGGEVHRTSHDVHPTLRTMVFGEGRLRVDWKSVPEIYLLPFQTQPGATNQSLNILSMQVSGKSVSVIAEGIAGQHYDLGIRNADGLAAIEGATQANDRIGVDIPSGPAKQFVKHTIVLHLK